MFIEQTALLFQHRTLNLALLWASSAFVLIHSFNLGAEDTQEIWKIVILALLLVTV